MATIYDVARVAGVSPKTVSRVLNGHAPVNKDTRKTVEDTIAALAYVPSSAARTMRSNKSGLVGLVTGAISATPRGREPIGLPDIYIVQGLQRVLAENGITLLISDTGGRSDRVPDLVRTLQEHRVEGLVYVADHHQQIKLPTPSRINHLILVNCFDDAGTPCVLPDDMSGQYELVQGLIARGHGRIGFLTLPEDLIACQLRLEGYQRALAEAAIPFDPDLVIAADANGLPGEANLVTQAIERLLELDTPPTVLCCGNDRLAVRVYGILRSKGITVPEQMSVAGYDDYRVISETLYPPLTTVDLPYVGMGEQAAQQLLTQMRGTASGSEPILVGGGVRWRESVTRLIEPTKKPRSQRRIASCA